MNNEERAREIQRALGSSEELRRAIKAVEDTIGVSALRTIPTLAAQMRADARNFHSTIGTFAKQAATIGSVLDAERKSISKILGDLRTTGKILAESNTIGRFLAETKSTGATYKLYADALKLNAGIGQTQLQVYKDLLESTSWKVLADSIKEAAHSVEDVPTQNAVNEALAEATTLAPVADGNVSEAFEGFALKLFQKLDPVVAWPILFSIILMLLTPFWDYYVKDALSKTSPQEDRRTLAKEIAKEIGKLDLNPIYAAGRRIATRSLVVHMNAKALSPKVGQLRMGEVVALITTDGAWSQISWRDSDGREMVGWVFTRYLRPLQ